MTPHQAAEQECPDAGMTGEEQLAVLYCQPKPIWHCTRQLDPPGYYTFNEINYPENWLKVVAKYTQQQPSPAARQLHRRVEAARAELRARQDKIFPISRSTDRIGLNERYHLEDLAWDRFNRKKAAYLKDYQKTVAKGGVLKRIRLTHKCKQCGESGVSKGRQFCEVCRKERARESSRKWKAKNRGREDILGALQATQNEPLAKALFQKKGHLATTIAERP
jgi:hypothetical protein